MTIKINSNFVYCDAGDAELVREDVGCDASRFQSTPPDSLALGHEVCGLPSDPESTSTTPVMAGLTIVDVHEGFRDVVDDRAGIRTTSDGSIPEQQQTNESKTVGDQYVWVRKQVATGQSSVVVASRKSLVH